MKRTLLVFLLLFSFNLNAQNDRQILLLKTLKQFDSALVKKDTVRLGVLLSEFYSMEHSNGLKEARTDFFRNLRDGYLKYDEIIQEGEVKVDYDEELAFVKRDIKVKGSLNGQNYDVELTASELWSWDFRRKIWQIKWRISKKRE